MIENLNEALEILKNYKKIIVTGPQRSGTTITGKILSVRLNLKYLDEMVIKVRDKKLFDQVVNERNNFVLQCPSMSYYIHNIGNREDVFIVFMKRDVHDILLSQYRINWTYDKSESLKYINAGFDVNIDIPISIIKYHIWNKYQKNKIKNKMELWYECLKTDDMWIDKKFRKNFYSKQTEIRKHTPEDLRRIKERKKNHEMMQKERMNKKNKSGFKKI